MSESYFNEWAGRILFCRDTRRLGIPCPDSPPPAGYTPEDVLFALKLVAHWEGGPVPEDPAAVPVELEFEAGRER
jgi:hypothetical protein